ncbi:MAG: hypothetical protein N0E44_23650, partial [Candidatus Thiodiazotropha lotti]|nr:hypothetical protein [Candidatus Thiodiazotropha lotti]MCW4222860.1 hypothetical protein [Candidatus Thiodiazotropha lotti]
MATAAQASNHPQQKKQDAHEKRTGLIGNTLGLLIAMVGWMVVALVINILVEVAGIAFGWWELTGSQHARQVLLQELEWLNSDFKYALGNPLHVALSASES